jgi:AcrR family transcriptional regulator
MEARAPDRRVQRTRKLLQEALMTLILEKGYEAMTIQDIIDRANVGRATFYNHFLDKQDLLVSGFAELRVSLAQRRTTVTEAGPPRLGFSLG